MKKLATMAIILFSSSVALSAPANFNCISTLGSMDDATLAISASLISGTIVSSTLISDPKIVNIEAFDGKKESTLSLVAFSVDRKLKKLTMKLLQTYNPKVTGEITIQTTGPGTGAFTGTQVIKAQGTIMSDRRVFCDVIVNDGWKL